VATFEDILGRLMTHANAARAAGGAEITKSDSFYSDRLGFLDGDQRKRVRAWCQTNGIEARFGEMPFGGMNLAMRAVGS
jgi:hypothetical protein